jgi:hypothetical protein
MSVYPKRIHRCHHIKVNGLQCGSPSLRNQKFCFFHQQWRPTRFGTDPINPPLPLEQMIPVLEDANSIQMGLMEVMRMLITRRVDHRTAGLLLYGLQTSSANLRWTTFEPELPTQVVIDEECVEHRPIGATAWSIAKGKKYDAVKVDPVEPRSLAKTLIEQLGLMEEIPEDMRGDPDQRAEAEIQESRRRALMHD